MAHDSFSRLEGVLRNFASGEEPAVMLLRGEWGVGKTYACKQALKEITPLLAEIQLLQESAEVAATPRAATETAREQLLRTLCEILRRELIEPQSEAQIGELLGVANPQVKTWLNQLIEEGFLKKTKRPTKYIPAKSEDQLL